MPICSYVVVPLEGAAGDVAARLSALPGCDLVRAENRDVLLVVTDTRGPEDDRALRDAMSKVEGIGTLVMVFGEVEPEPAR